MSDSSNEPYCPPAEVEDYVKDGISYPNKSNKTVDSNISGDDVMFDPKVDKHSPQEIIASSKSSNKSIRAENNVSTMDSLNNLRKADASLQASINRIGKKTKNVFSNNIGSNRKVVNEI